MIRTWTVHPTPRWLASILPAQSVDEDENLVNFRYAVVFGTRVQKITAERAYVVRVPFSYRLLEPSTERLGMKLLLPASAGYYN